MPFPDTSRLELPILQELKATGGGDQLRYLYGRLPRYFPQLTRQDLEDRAESGRSRWARAVQRAGRQLEEKGELRREKNHWKITARGLRRVEDEAMTLDAPAAVERKEKTLTHKEAQAMLVEIGLMLGKHAEAEFEHYDVVWRDAASSTRLKHAYDAQRSRPFLVIAGERDRRFAGKRLTGSFHEIWDIITVIGVGELERLYEALKTHKDMIGRLVGRT